MIKKLSIRNYTLIDELNIEFNSGFSVITGETGAGKSIILGALSLILGRRNIYNLWIMWQFEHTRPRQVRIVQRLGYVSCAW